MLKDFALKLRDPSIELKVVEIPAMNPDAAVELFSSNSVLLMRPSGVSSDGHRFSDRITLQLPLPATIGVLGAKVFSVLQASANLTFAKNREQLLHDRPAVMSDLLANLGQADLAAAVKVARYIRVVRYGDEIDIEHSEAHNGSDPGFRPFSKAHTLKNPSPEELGTEILAAFERCTWAEE